MPDSPVAPAVAAESGAAAGSAARRRVALRLARAGFVVVAAGLCGYALVRQWPQVRAGVAALGGRTVGLSLVAVLAGLVATMLVWRTLLAALGSPLPLRVAARIFFLGQLGKYIPGSMWPIVAQMDMARAYRVPGRRSATAGVLTMLVSLAAGFVAAVAVLPALAGPDVRGYRWLFLAVPVLLAGLHPRVVNPVVDRLLRLVGRPPLDRPLGGRAVAAAFGWALLSWILLGAQIWLMAVRFGAPPGRSVPLAVGGFAFAWAAGFLVVFAPAGVGVRDVLLVAVLGRVLDGGPATTVAVVSRILMTLGDLLLAAAAGWRGRVASGRADRAQTRSP